MTATIEILANHKYFRRFPKNSPLDLFVSAAFEDTTLKAVTHIANIPIGVAGESSIPGVSIPILNHPYVRQISSVALGTNERISLIFIDGSHLIFQ